MAVHAPPLKHLKSLREYIDALAAIGEVQHVAAEVDLDLEIGAIIRRSYELKAPAPLFQTIKDVARGFRILGAPAGVSAQPGLYLSRIAIALGLDPSASGQDIISTLTAARSRAPIAPVCVKTGPCKDNVVVGDGVDIRRFPAPLLHGGDGGRYINTYGAIVVRTPDGTWTNWSIARIMILDRNRMTGIVAPGQHVGIIHQMWKDIGRDTPFALALGVEPAIPFVCGMPLPAHVSEADYVGAIFGEGVEIVKCETSDLHVPATAEIVLEGSISATDVAPEGPMGEYAGYQWRGVTTDKPVYHVAAMTFRTDPILPVSVAGEPVEEDHTAWGIPNAAEVVFELRQAGIPVTTAWCPFEAANHWLVVTVPSDWRAHIALESGPLCKKIGETLFHSHCGDGMVKVLVMEDDIDPTNTADVVWAFATRSHPGTSECVFDPVHTAALAVFLSNDEKRTMQSSKSVFNCLTRDEWTRGEHPSRTAFRYNYPPSIQERVLANWHTYGFK